jgi:hypothetical protein
MEKPNAETRARLMLKIWSGQDLSPEESADEPTRLAWDELEPQRQGAPFRFQRGEDGKDLPSCLARIRGRVAELQQIMPVFEQVTSLSFLRARAIKEFQRMVSLLDLAGRGLLPEDFSEWREKLDQIDESLEKTLNQVGSQLRENRTREAAS